MPIATHLTVLSVLVGPCLPCHPALAVPRRAHHAAHAHGAQTCLRNLTLTAKPERAVRSGTNRPPLPFLPCHPTLNPTGPAVRNAHACHASPSTACPRCPNTPSKPANHANPLRAAPDRRHPPALPEPACHASHALHAFLAGTDLACHAFQHLPRRAALDPTPLPSLPCQRLPSLAEQPRLPSLPSSRRSPCGCGRVR